MFTALIPAATFPGVLAAIVVQKIFFTIAGTFVYLYLFLSVPGSFDVQPRPDRREPGRGDRDPRRRRLPDRHPRPRLLAAARSSGRRRSRAGRSSPTRRPTSSGRSCRRSCPGPQARRDRGLPGRVRDPGHVRVGHVGDGSGLARQHRLRHPRRGRHHAGDEQRCARHLLRRPEERRGRLLHRRSSSSRPPGTSWSRSCSPSRSSAGRAGKLVGESYTDAKDKVGEQKAQRAEKKAEKKAERAQEEAEGGGNGLHVADPAPGRGEP